MTSPSGALDARVARIVHGAMVASVIVAGALVVTFRTQGLIGADAVSSVRTLLRVVVVAVLLAESIGVGVLAAQMSARRMRGDPRAVVVWALGETAGLLGAAVYVVSGDMLSIGVAAVWALAILTIFSPGRLWEDADRRSST